MRTNNKGRSARLALFLFGLSGLVPVLALAGSPPDTMPLIYLLFVASVFVCRRPCLPAGALVPAFVVTGWVTEVLAWGSDVLAGKAIPVTFHPQLGVDLVLATGFYGGLGLGWALLRRWFAFSLAEVFVLAGIFGVLIEQDGAVLGAILANLATAPLGAATMALYVFAVYGAFSALPMRLTAPGPGRSRHWVRGPLALAAAVVLPRLGMGLILGLWSLLGGVPAARSALAHPLW